MKNKIYTKEEAKDLIRTEQIGLLAIRGIKVKNNISKNELIKKILGSNPKDNKISSQNEDIKALKLSCEEVTLMKKVLEIARAGFPSKELLIFIDNLKEKLK